MRKVVVVTGSRADYWLLRPLLLKLNNLGMLKLFITGENLHSFQLQQIKDDGFIVTKKIECLLRSDTSVGLAKAISTGINNFTEALAAIVPDLIVLLGDRYEIFAAAIASYALKIPIAHIHGGEITEGSLDDGFRHAIAKLSSTHFVSHEEYKKRLIRMGEAPEKIYNVGAIGLDNLNNITFSNKEDLFHKYNFLQEKDYFLLTLHPSTLSTTDNEIMVNTVILALEEFVEYNIVVTKSNSDLDSLLINERLCAWSKYNKNVYFVPLLGDDYLKIAYFSKIVIGNSSSGILEIPYLDKPVINIGDRQKGRLIPKGVYNVDCDVVQIKLLVNYILENHINTEKIYGIPGKVSENILNIINKLSDLELTNLIYKKFYDAK